MFLGTALSALELCRYDLCRLLRSTPTVAICHCEVSMLGYLVNTAVVCESYEVVRVLIKEQASCSVCTTDKESCYCETEASLLLFE